MVCQVPANKERVKASEAAPPDSKPIKCEFQQKNVSNYGMSSRNGSFLLPIVGKTQEYGVSIKPSPMSLWCFQLVRYVNDRSNTLQWTVSS